MRLNSVRLIYAPPHFALIYFCQKLYPRMHPEKASSGKIGSPTQKFIQQPKARWQWHPAAAVASAALHYAAAQKRYATNARRSLSYQLASVKSGPPSPSSKNESKMFNSTQSCCNARGRHRRDFQQLPSTIQKEQTPKLWRDGGVGGILER